MIFSPILLNWSTFPIPSYISFSSLYCHPSSLLIPSILQLLLILSVLIIFSHAIFTQLDHKSITILCCLMPSLSRCRKFSAEVFEGVVEAEIRVDFQYLVSAIMKIDNCLDGSIVLMLILDICKESWGNLYIIAASYKIVRVNQQFCLFPHQYTQHSLQAEYQKP